MGQKNDQGQPHGIAKCIDLNGYIIIEGEFVNGKLHGYGRRVSEHDYYVGEFVNGVIHGYGTYAHKMGTYVGNRKKGIIQGSGKFFKKNGMKFEGEWVNSRLNGVHWSEL